MSPEAIRLHASEVFGFDALRPGQLEVIEDVLAGRPVVTVMPTGAGKSLCYQLPAVLLGRSGGVALVVSPLIALMKDQVDSLRARGIEAAALTSAASSFEQTEILDGIRAGLFTLVYVAPERFRSPRFRQALVDVGGRLQLFAIDEAHCISHWGHDFRPDYRTLGEVVRHMQPPRLIALTATATPEVRSDIAQQLHMAEPRFHVRGFDRPNLFFAVERAGGVADKSARLVERVKSRRSGVALVYAATRKNAERYGEALADAGLRVGVYHAGLEDAERVEAQESFMGDRLDVIVATNAFGMGVDKGDIHLVIHADLPRSPEAYYQEAGRGGRDGELAGCLLLFNHSDARLQEFLIDASIPTAELLRALWKTLRDHPELGSHMGRLRLRLPPGAAQPDKPPHEGAVRSAVRLLTRHGFLRQDGEYLVATRPDPSGRFAPLDVAALEHRREIERSKLRSMIEYAYYPRCRRQFILEYFGDADWDKRDRGCTGCDNCLGAGPTAPLSADQKQEVLDLLGLVERLSGRFGRTRLAGLANGTDDDARFAALPERGVLRGRNNRYVLDLMRSLEGGGLIEVSRDQYPVVSITRRGKRAVASDLDLDDFGLILPARKAGSRKKRDALRTKLEERDGSGDSPAAGLADPAVIDRLRELRTRLATENSVPAYVVFSNRTLEAIARARPTSEDELLAVPGIGPNRLDAYGALILAAVAAQ